MVLLYFVVLFLCFFVFMVMVISFCVSVPCVVFRGCALGFSCRGCVFVVRLYPGTYVL